MTMGITMITGHDHGHNHKSSHAAEAPPRTPVRHLGDSEGFTSLSFCSRRPFGLRKIFRIFSTIQTAAGGCFAPKHSSGQGKLSGAMCSTWAVTFSRSTTATGLVEAQEQFWCLIGKKPRPRQICR